MAWEVSLYAVYEVQLEILYRAHNENYDTSMKMQGEGKQDDEVAYPLGQLEAQCPVS